MTRPQTVAEANQRVCRAQRRYNHACMEWRNYCRKVGGGKAPRIVDFIACLEVELVGAMWHLYDLLPDAANEPLPTTPRAA